MATAKAAGVETPTQATLLKTLAGAHRATCKPAAGKLEHALAHHADGDPYAHSKHARDAVIPAMNAGPFGRRCARRLGGRRPWPLPSYREMLFIK